MCLTYVLVYCVRVFMYLYVCICFPTPSVCVCYMCVCVYFLCLLECDSRRDTKSHGPRTVTPNVVPRITL
jgi:hypothetical protein